MQNDRCMSNDYIQDPERHSFIGLVPLSDSVLRLGRKSYTIRDFFGPLHRVPIATDRIVRLCLIVDQVLKALVRPVHLISKAKSTVQDKSYF